MYALALAELGPEEVGRRVGSEPSGEAFNAISLEPGTGRPDNPMVNAGAIVTTSLIAADGSGQGFERIRSCLSAFAGRPLDVDEAVYASETATGDRNRALAYLMRAAGSLTAEVGQVLEAYVRQCAVRVTAADLAVMAATLANGGTNPVTGEQVVSEEVTVQTLAVMATCGMYDGAGAWLMNAGLPAKSGVSGGLIAASPARFGIAVYSPRLDPAGNPVRGVVALTELSQRFALHLMHPPAQHAVTVTAATTAREQPSARPRDPAQRQALRQDGQRIAVVRAQGTLEFTESEQLLQAVQDTAPPSPGWIVLDLERVTSITAGSAAMLAVALGDLAAQGHRIALTAQRSLLERARPEPAPWTVFPDADEALAWCEDGLLAELGTD